MKNSTKILTIAALACSLLISCKPEKTSIYQLSYIESLMQGNYDGTKKMSNLKEHGNFGIGTFDHLDGEMILLDGTVYQAKADGSVVVPPDSLTTPYATSCWFNSTIDLELNNIKDIEILSKVLKESFPSKDRIYAIEITGEFDSVRVRSVQRQEKPYAPLLKVVKKQSIFSYTSTSGTLVGFYCPQYMGKITVAGLHMHFLTADLHKGGHLLNVVASKPLSCHISVFSRINMDLSSNQSQPDATGSTESDINKVEH